MAEVKESSGASTEVDATPFFIPDKAPPLDAGRLQVVILQVETQVALSRPYLTITIGDQVYRTSTAESDQSIKYLSWHEGFEFRISFHGQLFGSLQLDLYSSRWLLPDLHVGRASLRLSLLEGLPDSFVSWVEFWEPKYADADKARSATMFAPSPSSPTAANFRVSNVGAARLRLHYRYQERSSIHRGDSEGAENTLVPSDEEDFALYRRKVADLRNAGDDGEDKGDHIDTSLSDSPPPRAEDIPPKPSSLTRNESSGSIAGEVTGLTMGDEVEETGILDSIGGYFVGPETKRNLKAVMSMAKAFGQGFELSYVELLNGAAILERFYATIPVPRLGLTMEGYETSERAAHFHRFALASYGWKGLNFFGHGNGIINDSLRRHSDVRSIREFLRLGKDDLLLYDLHGRIIFRPSYYVALDRETDSIVLAVRGTMSFMDTLTDLVCEYQPWRTGLVHAGMKNAALWFLTEILPSVIMQCDKHGIRNLVLVGHSLGAGTASILTMLLRDLKPTNKAGEPIHVRCMAYGPPCIISEDIAGEDYGIESFILGDDVVPRLSYGSCMDIRTMLVVASELTPGGVGNLISYGVGKARDTDEEWAAKEKVLSDMRSRLKHGDRHRHPKLFVAGRVHQLFVLKDGTVEMRQTEAKAFTEVGIRSDMLRQHLPGSYDKAMEGLRETVKKKKDDAGDSPGKPVQLDTSLPERTSSLISPKVATTVNGKAKTTPGRSSTTT